MDLAETTARRDENHLSFWELECLILEILLGKNCLLNGPLDLACQRASLNLPQWINSLAPGKFEWNFRYVIFKWILVIDGWGISWEITLIWMSLDFTNDQSILVQVMAWCRQATSHYLSQCWPRYLSPYGVKRPEWVKERSLPKHQSPKC